MKGDFAETIYFQVLSLILATVKLMLFSASLNVNPVNYPTFWVGSVHVLIKVVV